MRGQEEKPPEQPYEIPEVEEAYRVDGYSAEDAKSHARKAVKAVVTRRLGDPGPRDRYWRKKPGEKPIIGPR